MKKTDDVFFFTLIDFLIQVFFFGLVIYAFAQESNSKIKDSHKSEHEKVETILKATGISNLSELSDELSKLAPISELKGFSDFISKSGGIDKLKIDVQVVADTGGAENLMKRLERLRKIEEGSGKPPCLYTEVNGRKVVRPLATVIASDTDITFTGTNPELEKLLAKLGHSYASVHELSIAQFKVAFQGVTKIDTECRYTLKFLESTDLVFARDSARSIFYLNYGKL